jgi:hypothetical protein
MCGIMPPKGQNAVKQRICEYGDCMLNDNNRGYVFQLIYLLFVLFCMNTLTEFGTTAVFMFVVPLAVDLWNAKLIKLAPKILRIILCIINIAIVAGCVMVYLGKIKEGTGDYTYTNAVLNFHFSINKTHVARVLLGEALVIPGIMILGVPTKKTTETKKFVKNIIKRV